MISLIGMGSGCPENLTTQGLAALQSAGLILGAKRLLEHLPVGCTDNCKAVYKPEEILACLTAQPDTDTAVLYSGDTGFYSGAAKLLPLLRAMGYSVRVLPGLSSVQLLAAAVGRPWQDWKLVSAHGRACDPVAEVLAHPQVFFLTGGGDTPATLCAKLTAAGLGAAHALVGENLGTPAETIHFGLARELAAQSFAPLSVLLIEREALPPRRTPGLPDDAFIRGAVPMTKQEVPASAALRDTQLFVNRTMAFMGPVMTLIMYGVTVMIEWFGAKSINAGNMQIGDMIAFSTYASLIIMAFMMITIVAVLLPRAEVSATRVDEILRTRASVRDPRSPEPVPADATVTFDHVSFRYPGAEDDVLHDISFTARPGEVTAIVGSTGCGKSTLLNLIPRFYDATGGTVSIGGVNVRRLPQTGLRAMLGYVPQKGVLFTGDILSNLEFAGDVSEADAIRAAATAQAEDFIWSRPHHFLTPVAQGGANVSGGQRQRLSIARAIARHPQVYLFDDSFSALDYQTDAALRQALAKQTHDATVIIVAQRLSTILHADQILVLDGGRIVGCGTDGTLRGSCEAYREIALSQLSAAELGEEG